MSKSISTAALGRTVPVTASEVAGAQRRLSRAALLFGTALGCSLTVVALGAPNAAWAANECGAVVNSAGADTATCVAGNYPNGISYTEAGTNNITVILDGGVTVETTTAPNGVFVDGAANYNSSLITAAGDTITATYNGEAVFASGTGNAYMDNGADVSAYGRGLNVFASGSGNVSIINTGNVTVKGPVGAGTYAVGILAETAGNGYINNSGAVTVNSATGYGVGVITFVDGNLTILNSGDINVTSGAGKAYGIFTYNQTTSLYLNNSGNVTVNATGGGAIGLDTSSSGDTTIVQTGAVSATAAGTYSAQGVHADAGGNLSVTTGAVSAISAGGYAVGVYAEATGNTSVSSSGPIYASGHVAVGVNAYSETGTVIVNVGNVTSNSSYGASGNHGYGIKAVASGDMSVSAGSVVTSGDYATGVYAHSTGGNITMGITSVSTTGYEAAAINAEATGNIVINTNSESTTGNFSDGIVADSSAGTVSITAGNVFTTGFASAGIDAYGRNGASVSAVNVQTTGDDSTAVEAFSFYGNVSVTTGYVRTSGNDSAGIDAYGNTGSYVHNTGYVVTTGVSSTGIDASSEYGPTAVVSHTVITTGNYSDAIDAYAYSGNVSVTSDNVVTHGVYSYGIDVSAYTGNVTVNSGNAVTYGDHSPAVVATTYYGDVSVTSTMAVTHGNYSPGIMAYSYRTGNVTVNSGTVVTFGNYSPGIVAAADTGNVSVTSGSVTTHGYESYGISASAYTGNVTIHSGSVTTYGEYATAIRGAAGTGDVTITTTGATYTHGYDADAIEAGTFVAGNVTVNTGGITHADDGVGVHIIATGYATENNSGSIFGGRGGIVAYSLDGTTINNGDHASISGGNGYAIGVSGASAVINNAGVINGYAYLSSINNTVNNTGTWNAYGNSYFGPGGTNVFNNGPGGTVHVAPFSTSATTVVWNGLSAFNNEGLVDLRNGHTGDIFDLPGTTFTGSVNSTLAIDANLGSALSADELIIGPAAGSTTVIVNPVGGPPALNFVGVPVVQATAGTASNFVMSTLHEGFVDFGLSFNASTFTWSLVGLPGQPAFEFLKVPAMAEGFWRRTGDAWSAREQEIRDSMWGSDPGTRSEGWEMWSQAQIGGERLGNTETFNIQGFTFTPNLRTDTDWRGFQMGADALHGNMLWGFTGGFLEQNTIFHADRNSLDMTGWNFGAYGGWTSGHFFINGLIKGDWYDLKSNMPTVPAYEAFNGNTWGVKGETGFRFGGHSFYMEPVADVAWTSSHLDDANFHGLNTNFTFGNNTMARGSIGARFGGQWGSILPYVGIYAVDEWDDNAKLTMITGSGCPGSCISIEDEHPGSYGKADLGFTTTSWNGLMGFVKVEDEFGSHVDGFIGRLGVRWRW